MPKLSYSLVLLGCILLSMSPAPHAQAWSDVAVVVGVNLTDTVPPKQSESWQEATLTTLQNAGVRVIRATISNDDRGVAFAQRAFAHGIKIAWLVPVASPAGNMILSSADPEKFRTYFQPLLAKVESKGIILAGLELGNEINWSNHDLGPEGTGRVLGTDDLLHDPKGQQVAKGYLNYIKVLSVLKDVRDHSQLNHHVPIMTAGLAPFEPPGPAGSTGQMQDAVGVNATIQFLRAHGADEFVDAYGLHFYPNGNATPAARLSSLKQLMAQCRKDKPGWITEWGLPVTSGKSYPVVDTKRTAIFTELRDDFHQFAQQDRLKGLIFYTWEGSILPNGVADNNPFGAVLYGSLTKSGRIAIAPMQ